MNGVYYSDTDSVYADEGQIAVVSAYTEEEVQKAPEFMCGYLRMCKRFAFLPKESPMNTTDEATMIMQDAIKGMTEAEAKEALARVTRNFDAFEEEQKKKATMLLILVENVRTSFKESRAKTERALILASAAEREIFIERVEALTFALGEMRKLDKAFREEHAELLK